MAAKQALHYAADSLHAGDRISIRSSVQCQMVINLHKYLDKSETHTTDTVQKSETHPALAG